MTATLQEALLAPDTRPQVVADGKKLLEHQVSGLHGVSGAAIKIAYKTVMLFSSDHVRYMIDSLLPQMADELEPYWTEFNATGDTDFGAYLAAHGEKVSEALLSVTDARGRASDRPVIIKAYNAVRDRAAKHVQAALPQVGALVQKYAG
ncbi:MAG: DUF6918 family protein [Streptosporangiaceae bacterium]